MIHAIEDITEARRTAVRARDHEAALARVLRASLMAELMSVIVHDLGQPLASISNYCRGSVRALTRGDVDVREVIENLETAADQTELAGGIVRRARAMVSKNRSTNRKTIDINKLVVDAVKLIDGKIEQDRIDVVLDLASVPVRARVDDVALEQVFMNLILNAVEAIELIDRDNHRLTIRTLADDKDCVEVSIEDTGVGIREDRIDTIFTPFNTTKVDGMGMGLAICKTLVEAQGGTVNLVGTGDRGSAFRVTLPAPPPGQADGT